MLDILVLGEVMGRRAAAAVTAPAAPWRADPVPAATLVSVAGPPAPAILTRDVVTALLNAGCSYVLAPPRALATPRSRPLPERLPRLLRAANLPPGFPGGGVARLPAADGPLALIVLATPDQGEWLADPVTVGAGLLAALPPALPALLLLQGRDLLLKQALLWHLRQRHAAPLHVVGSGLLVATVDAAADDGLVTVGDVGVGAVAGALAGWDPAAWWERHRLRRTLEARDAAGPVCLDGVRLSLGDDGRATVRRERWSA